MRILIFSTFFVILSLLASLGLIVSLSISKSLNGEAKSVERNSPLSTRTLEHWKTEKKSNQGFDSNQVDITESMCIISRYQCDADDQHCLDTQNAKTGKCIIFAQICDRRNDCGNNEDEEKRTKSGTFCHL